jgi:hypothetical protein
MDSSKSNCGKAMSPKGCGGEIIIKESRPKTRTSPKESPQKMHADGAPEETNKPDAIAIANTDIKDLASSSRPSTRKIKNR